MPKVRRRAIFASERTAPCDCCGYPLAHRHHYLEFAEFGETDEVAYLCPNCHDLYHLVKRDLLLKSSRCRAILNTFSQKGCKSALNVLAWLQGKVLEVEGLRHEIKARIAALHANRPKITADVLNERIVAEIADEYCVPDGWIVEICSRRQQSE